jgi:hypothetical protein
VCFYLQRKKVGSVCLSENVAFDIGDVLLSRRPKNQEYEGRLSDFLTALQKWHTFSASSSLSLTRPVFEEARGNTLFLTWASVSKGVYAITGVKMGLPKPTTCRHLEVGTRPLLPEQRLRFSFTAGARVRLHQRPFLPYRPGPFPSWLGIAIPTLEHEGSPSEALKLEALLTEGVREERVSSVMGQSRMESSTGPQFTPGSPQEGRPRFSVPPESWGFRDLKSASGTNGISGTNGNNLTNGMNKSSWLKETRGTCGTKGSSGTDGSNGNSGMNGPGWTNGTGFGDENSPPASSVSYEKGQLYEELLPLSKSTLMLLGGIRRTLNGTPVVSNPSCRSTPEGGLLRTGDLGTREESRSGGAVLGGTDVERGKRVVRLLHFDGKEEAQRRAVLLYALTYSVRVRSSSGVLFLIALRHEFELVFQWDCFCVYDAPPQLSPTAFGLKAAQVSSLRVFHSNSFIRVEL